MPTAAEVAAQSSANIKGQTFLFTGATIGSIAAAAAVAIAAAGPTQIILVGRSQSKLDELAKLLQPVEVLTFTADLSSVASSRAAAEAINTDERVKEINYVVNSAFVGPTTLEKSVDGVELGFAVSHVGHFVLTTLLAPKLTAKDGKGRVVNVTSAGHRIAELVPFEPAADIQPDEYRPWIQYGRAKTANILFTRSLAQRGWSAASVHPGPTLTPMYNQFIDSMPAMIAWMSTFPVMPKVTENDMGRQPQTPEEAAGGVLQAVFSPAPSGTYFVYGEPHEPSKLAQDDEAAAKLWAHGEKLVGQKLL